MWMYDNEESGFISQNDDDGEGARSQCGVTCVEGTTAPTSRFRRLLNVLCCCCYGNRQKCPCLSNPDGCQCDDEKQDVTACDDDDDDVEVISRRS